MIILFYHSKTRNKDSVNWLFFGQIYQSALHQLQDRMKLLLQGHSGKGFKYIGLHGHWVFSAVKGQVIDISFGVYRSTSIITIHPQKPTPPMCFLASKGRLLAGPPLHRFMNKMWINCSDLLILQLLFQKMDLWHAFGQHFDKKLGFVKRSIKGAKVFSASVFALHSRKLKWFTT